VRANPHPMVNKGGQASTTGRWPPASLKNKEKISKEGKGKRKKRK